MRSLRFFSALVALALLSGCGEGGGDGGAGGVGGVGGAGGAGGVGGAPCPPELPGEGTFCGPEWQEAAFNDEGCLYTIETACGPTEVRATCGDVPDFSIIWFHRDVPTCASEGSDCAAYPSWTLCNADTSCRWISTRLSNETCDEALPEVPDTGHYGGCFAKEPCDATSCPDGLTCTAITPCLNMWCESCEPPTDVCLPSG